LEETFSRSKTLKRLLSIIHSISPFRAEKENQRRNLEIAKQEEKLMEAFQGQKITEVIWIIMY